MIKRCKNPTDTSYSYYGKIGICVCVEWNDFDVFQKWAIKNGYDDSLSIDRINPYGNYEPNNCRWVDSITQARNRKDPTKCLRDVVQLTLDGKYVATHCGVRQAMRSINASSHAGIVNRCRHKYKHAYGYKWMYADEYKKQEEKAK